MSNEKFKHKPGLADDCPICQNQQPKENKNVAPTNEQEKYKQLKQWIDSAHLTEELDKTLNKNVAHKLPDPGNISLESVKHLETQRKLYNAVYELQTIVSAMLDERKGNK